MVEEKKNVEVKVEGKPTTKVDTAKEVQPKKAETKQAVKVKSKTEPTEDTKKPADSTKPAKPIKIKPKQASFYFKAFGRWDTKDIQVTDPGLKRYISLRPVLVPNTAGRFTEKQFWKSKKPIIERLVNRVMVSGHKRKKHFRTSGPFSGKKHIAFKTIRESFEIIERRTKKNPVEVFVSAIEEGSPREGVTTIEYGGVAYPKAVDLSPQKRIDLVLRWFTQGAYHTAAASKAKKSLANALADEIILTYNGDNKSNCVSKKIDFERQAQASR